MELIRPLTKLDLGDACDLSSLAGWNQALEDWALFLSANPNNCFGAEVQGRIQGTAAVMNYGTSQAWVSMVLVHPDLRGAGLGTRLFLKAVESVGSQTGLGLDATDLGLGLYRREGFKEGPRLHRLRRGPIPGAPLPQKPVNSGFWKTMTQKDLGEAVDLDRGLFGAPRAGLLLDLWRRAPGFAYVQRNALGLLRGLCLGRPGRIVPQLGPLVAPSLASAMEALNMALGRNPASGLLMDVPATQTDFLKELEGLGFRTERSFVRMGLRWDDLAIPGEVYAVCGPEFG